MSILYTFLARYSLLPGPWSCEYPLYFLGQIMSTLKLFSWPVDYTNQSIGQMCILITFLARCSQLPVPSSDEYNCHFLGHMITRTIFLAIWLRLQLSWPNDYAYNSLGQMITLTSQLARWVYVIFLWPGEFMYQFLDQTGSYQFSSEDLLLRTAQGIVTERSDPGRLHVCWSACPFYVAVCEHCKFVSLKLLNLITTIVT
jgi:hypothetical protein